MFQQVSSISVPLIESAPKRKDSGKATKIIFKVFTILFLIFLCFLQFLPFYLEIVTSLHGSTYLRAPNVLYLWPRRFTLRPFRYNNYVTAVRQAHFFRGIRNSLIHSVSFTVLTLIIAFIFGYVLGKIKFRGRNIVFIAILSTLMVPGEVLMIPNFLLLQQIGLDDNLLGIILPGAVNIFGIFLFKQFMNTIPNELLESADIDGARETTKIFKIVFPMCLPVIATFVIITFTAAWNEYLWPMIVLNNYRWFTLQLTMNAFFPMFGTDRDQFVRAAGMILISLPIILLFCVAQKHFLQSLNISGMK